MWVVLVVAVYAANPVPLVEEREFVPFDLHSELLVDLLTALDDAQVRPVFEALGR